MAARQQHMQRKPLSEEEILRLLDESDGDISDLHLSSSDSEEAYERNEDSDSDTSTETENEQEPGNIRNAAAVTKRRELKWKTKSMVSRGPALSEDVLAPSEQKGILEAFFEYFPMDFWKLVTHQTNLKSVQDTGGSLRISESEILHFVGIEIIMGTLKLPQAKLYWTKLLHIPLISDTMPRDRYFKIRNHLHFADNLVDRSEDDKLWKIRPLVDTVRAKCVTLPRSPHLSIDEQMIPFAGRCGFRQYVPSKPNPLGLKNFVLAASDGLVLDFCMYVGKGTVPENDLKELGLGAAVVKLLSATIPENEGHTVYTDRFFTSIKSAEMLLEKKIYQTGTVMKNRIGTANSKLHDDKELNRGEWHEIVREDDQLCLVKWKDNKTVTLLSSCVGSDPVGTCKRWSKQEGKKIDVPRPSIVQNYNQMMGGIDLCDRLLAYYRTYVRTKKWPVRAFSHFVDLVIVNCWLMYRRGCKAEVVKKKDQLPLISYRLHLATSLVKFEGSTSGVRVNSDIPVSAGEDSSEEENSTPKRKYRRVVKQPIQEVRFDGVGHLPKYSNENFASKCRYPGCKSRSRVKCIKCDMYLCILKNNCFLKYHKR